MPQRKASIASKATGRLVYLGVKEGDAVKEGQLIARIEEADVAAHALQLKSQALSSKSRVIEEEANFNLAKAEFNRQEAVFKQGGLSQSQFEEFKNRLSVAQAKLEASRADGQAAEAALQAAQVELQNTRILAPFSGTILSKGADLGEVVSPISGSAQSKGYVVTLADMSTLEVEADVSEANISKVAVGQPCLITLDAYASVQYEGAVSAIVPTANRNKATILTKIKFNQLDGRVLPEMSAKVVFLETASKLADTTTRLAIPLSAVAIANGKKSAFFIDGEKVFAKEIQTGTSFGNFIEIKGGLAAGALVVNNPPKELKNGQRISFEKK